MSTKIFEFDKNMFNDTVKYNNNNSYIPFFMIGSFLIIIIILWIFRKNQLINKNLKIIKIVLLVLALLMLIINISFYNKLNNPVLEYVNNIDDSNYSVILVKNLLSNEECDQLLNDIEKGGKPFETSKVYNSDGSHKVTDYRNSKQVWLKDNHSKICEKITNIAQIFTGKPVENMEELQIVEYDVSGYFKEHYDPTVDDNKSNIKDRAYTLLFYLNNVEEGGETYFNKIDTKVTPSKGDAVFFKSLDQSSGKLLVNSLHQGMNVIKGKKIICNKWIHLNKFKL